MIVCSSLDDPRIPAMIKNGAVGLIPADTVYGLVAKADNKAAVQRLYDLKQRADQGKPGTVVAATIEQLIELGLHEQTLRAFAHLWPNPLSIVVATDPGLGYLDQGLGDLAVRIPNYQQLQELLKQTGPLLTSSANAPGATPATTVDQAQANFGDSVDFYVDGGDLSGHPPSTVAVIRNGKLQVVRPGAATIDP